MLLIRIYILIICIYIFIMRPIDLIFTSEFLIFRSGSLGLPGSVTCSDLWNYFWSSHLGDFGF